MLSVWGSCSFIRRPPDTDTAQVERIVACDASSLSFLREHGLDFNAWVDGVPFLALEQEASLRKQIEDQVWT